MAWIKNWEKGISHKQRTYTWNKPKGGYTGATKKFGKRYGYYHSQEGHYQGQYKTRTSARKAYYKSGSWM